MYVVIANGIEEPPIQEVLETNVVPRLIQFMTGDNRRLQVFLVLTMVWSG